MSSFVNFMLEIDRRMARYVNEMEENIFTDPSVSLMKARLFLEEIVDDIISIEGIESIAQDKLFDKLNYLSNGHYISRDVQGSFHFIRQKGNMGVHEREIDLLTHAFKTHKEMYNVATWYVREYKSLTVKIPVYT